MKLAIPVYSSDQFTWKGNRGCADASDFGSLAKLGREMFIGGRVYDDACDVGFYVVSAKTGVRMLFTYVNDEDDVTGWEFSSKEGHRIIIFND